MISFGAGVNSVAMTIMLVNDGWRGPIVFADPGAEHPDTYCYIEYFEREWLRKRGIEITRINPGSRWHKRSGLSLYDFCIKQGIVPYMMTRWCSKEWKVVPLMGWAEEHGVETRFIGFTVEEERRAKNFPGAVFPLIERDITRPECLRIIQRAGLDYPRKSGCFFCPGQPLTAWRDLYLNHRELYEQASALEVNVWTRTGRDDITLDPNGVTLKEKAARRWEGQMQFDLSEWMPCMCRL